MNFFKNYTKEDFKTDFKYFGGIILFIFLGWASFIVGHYIVSNLIH